MPHRMRIFLSTTMATTLPGPVKKLPPVLKREELAVASAYYDIGEIGDMHHNPAKNVLHVRGTLEGVAKSNGISLDSARELLASAKTKLYVGAT